MILAGMNASPLRPHKEGGGKSKEGGVRRWEAIWGGLLCAAASNRTNSSQHANRRVLRGSDNPLYSIHPNLLVPRLETIFRFF